jgi:hypothetical protein
MATIKELGYVNRLDMTTFLMSVNLPLGNPDMYYQLTRRSRAELYSRRVNTPKALYLYRDWIILSNLISKR